MGNLIRAPRLSAGLIATPIRSGDLILSNAAGDLNNDVAIGTGSAFILDSLGRSQLATLGSALTKRLDASWAAGNNAGGLASGTKANSTTYHVFLLYNETTKVVDACFSTSVTASDRPSGWVARMIGSVLTNGSGNLRQFVQRDDWFWWNSYELAFFGTSGPTTLSALAIAVPAGLAVEAQLLLAGPSAGFMHIATPGITDLAGSGWSGVPGNDVNNRIVRHVHTNTSAQINWRITAAGANAAIAVNGFRHPRGA